MLTGGALGLVQELSANSLSAMAGLNEKFVNPGAFATVFEAVIEADHQIADRCRDFTDDISDAVKGILQELGEIGANGGFVKGFFPRIVELHVAHHREEDFEIGEGSLVDGYGHVGSCGLN